MYAGKKAALIAAWLATNWFFDSVEISNPWLRPANKKMPVDSESNKMEPSKGTLNAKTEMVTHKNMEPIPSKKYGVTLPIINSLIWIGVESIASIDPLSHSLATTNAVNKVPINAIMIAIEPGNMTLRLFNSGLNQTLVCGKMIGIAFSDCCKIEACQFAISGKRLVVILSRLLRATSRVEDIETLRKSSNSITGRSQSPFILLFSHV